MGEEWGVGGRRMRMDHPLRRERRTVGGEQRRVHPPDKGQTFGRKKDISHNSSYFGLIEEL